MVAVMLLSLDSLTLLHNSQWNACHFSDSSIFRLWVIFKQRFTELIEVCISHHGGIIYIWCVKLQVQFRHLPQLGVPQLLKDVEGKDTNECNKCYGDGGVANCKLISFLYIAGSPNQDDQVQNK